MEKFNKALCASTVFLGLLTLILAGSTVCLYKKNADLNKIHGSLCAKVELDQSTSVMTNATSNLVSQAYKKEVQSTRFYEMKVRQFQNYGDTIKLLLSEKPDINVLKEYITITPKPNGPLSFSVARGWDWDYYRYLPQLVIKGDFAYRTNLTFCLKKGFPVGGVASSSNVVVQALKDDYIHTFKRQDESPTVAFTYKGRYLPPIGKRTLKFEAMNVSNADVKVSRVPAANIIPMLALEERAYGKISKNYWSGAGDAYVEDLSTLVSSETIKLKNTLNTPEFATFSFSNHTNITSKGFFFVQLIGDDQIKDCRVICISDMALSVRMTESKFLVWVTSLTTGQPVKDAQIVVYSKRNEPVVKGISDINGICEFSKVSNVDAFAVVASTKDGSDATFMALAESSLVNEQYSQESNEKYLDNNDITAFAWTERGIYRHEEKIFFHAILRNGEFLAPKAMPVEVTIKKPGGSVYLKKTVLSDGYGAVSLEDVKIPNDQPSGSWTFEVNVPGGNSIYPLAQRVVKIEDFAPPQVRTKVIADKTLKPYEFAFEIFSEHLFGGPAANLMCDGVIVFEDAPFAPAEWKGWRFGDANRALKPNFRMLAKTTLDGNGKAKIFAPLFADTGLPAAAIRAIAQGTVFEDGGRPATSRDTAILHYYPYYIGTTLKEWVKLPLDKTIKVPIACVAPNGKRVSESKKLAATLVRVDNVYSYISNGSQSSWHCERVCTTIAEDVEINTKVGGDTILELPKLECGDYELMIVDTDTDSEVQYSSKFYVSNWGDESVRAYLGNPSSVTLTADKKFYRPGDKPKIRVRSPFTGKALLGVFRDDLIYTEVVALTNATTEIELREIEAKNAPNIAVSLSVVHGVSPKSNHLAARAHGETVLSVRCPENEIEVKFDTKRTGNKLDVELFATNADVAVVTVVDEGINILTSEKTPDPIGAFSVMRKGNRLLFDLYNRLLPVTDDSDLKSAGLKTGGDLGAHLLGRVSPVASRRFKPLSLWGKCTVDKNGKAVVSFELPEFAGEVRVTALAYSKIAVGATSGQIKIAPKLVAQPDAPRFVAPGDEFTITLPMTNRSGKDGDVAYRIYAIFDGRLDKAKSVHSGEVIVKKDCTKTLPFTVTAPDKPGHIKLIFETSGFGEKHSHEIELPVRPAVAWRKTSGVEVLKTGDSFKLPKSADEFSKFTYSVSESPAAELKDALEWLADYPYGCLEQTVSRIFPLVTAGSALNAFSSIEPQNRAEYVKAGVRRVEAMYNYGHFLTWPDCRFSKADRELELYAIHFLLEAQNASVELDIEREGIIEMLSRATQSLSESAYACHNLALANEPDKGRMYSLYDSKDNLDALSRARLARAFVLIGDRARAIELLSKNIAPQSVKEAAFTLVTLLELGNEDKRVNELVKYLASKRTKERYSWGTTGENSHALFALAEYYRRMPASLGISDVREVDGEVKNIGMGTAFLSWNRLDLPKFEEVKSVSNGLSIEREYFTASGKKYDFSKSERGDFIVIRIAVSSDETRELSDLVIEDLLPGALEGVRSPIVPSLYSWMDAKAHEWILRHEVRDDRVLVFSKSFTLNKGDKAYFYYPVRVVSAGEYTVPGVSVEAMYYPELRAYMAPRRFKVAR